MTPDNGLGPGLFPLSAVYKFRPASTDEQLSLIGDPIPVRISAVEWTTWLTDVSVRTRYWAKVHRTSPVEDCWFFIGGISSTGHATFEQPHGPAGRDAAQCQAICTGTNSRAASFPDSVGERAT